MICSLWPCRHHYQRHFCNCGCHSELGTVGEALRKRLEWFLGWSNPFAHLVKLRENLWSGEIWANMWIHQCGDTVIHVKVLSPLAASIYILSVILIIPKTNIFALQMDGWKTSRSFWGRRPIFRGHIRFREGNQFPLEFFNIKKLQLLRCFSFIINSAEPSHKKRTETFMAGQPTSEMRG